MSVNKAIMSLVWGCTLASCAGAAEALTNGCFTAGTSFECRGWGPLDASRGDEADGQGYTYWLPIATNIVGAVVTNYETGAAYDYAAHGMTRNPLLVEAEPAANRYLNVALDEPLERLVLPRSGEIVTNVPMKTSGYDGLYADTLVRFVPSPNGPAIDAADKIVLWLRERQEGGVVTTNLMITAGRYAGDYQTVVAAEYEIVSPFVAAETWCRLTIRAISNVTSNERMPAPGFALYVDGKPVCRAASSSIGTLAHPEWLTAEARFLDASGRLFPWMAAAGSSRAMALSRCSFSGQCAIDDVTFSTESPDYAAPANVFTLNWDAGIVSPDMLCIVSNATGVTTNHIDTTEVGAARYRDFAIGTNDLTVVTVTNVVYDYAHDFTNGFWSARNGCVLTNGVFCARAGGNPIGTVASTRKYIGIGTNGVAGCVGTFTEAKRLLSSTNGVKTLVLETDLTIAVEPYVKGVARDQGYLPVSAGEDLILDLNGHELRGNAGTAAVIDQTGGSLRIIDSDAAKRGRVVPSHVRGEYSNVSVRVYANVGRIPTNVIEAGWFDGAVVVTGRSVNAQPGGVSTQYMPVCRIGGGSFTNLQDASAFYLEQYVTNATAYYGLASGNWWQIVTNGFVWCGRGADARWDDPENWRCRAVPHGDDLAIVPNAVPPVAIDFGEGSDIRAFRLDGDLAMTGTNDFTVVRIVAGEGRLVGTGTAAFTGELPGRLTEGYTARREIRLGADWRGTVKIAGVTQAQNMTNLVAWGVAGSRLELNGVRGYVNDRRNYSLPFELVLTDDGATPAWRNETGYTGSTIGFPRLSGGGTFDSPANLRDVQQVYRFTDVADFTGAFRMGGKRLVLGAGASAAGTTVGEITFAEGVRVRTGKDNGWTAASARFGKTLYVTGEAGDVLLAYAGTAPEVREVTVFRTGRDGLEVTNWLSAASGKIRVVGTKPPAAVKMMFGAKPIYATQAGDLAKSGATLGVLPGSAVSIVGNDVLVDGWIVSTIAGYYAVSGDAASGYSVSFDEPAVKPAVVEFGVSEGAGGIAEIVVANARAGLSYGVETRASLAADGWTPPETWIRAEEDGELYLPAPKTGDAGSFYRVLVTDNEP